MRIENRTQWNTRDLSRIIRAVVKHEGHKNPNRIAIVSSKSRKSNRKGKYHGTAYNLGKQIVMRIPTLTFTNFEIGNSGRITRRFQSPRIFNTKLFSQILVHELSHLAGNWKHKDMTYWWDANVDYTNSFTVTAKEKKTKPKRNLVQERYQKALAKVKEKQTSLSRNKNLLKKWQKRVKYYEKKLGVDQHE